MMSNGGIRIRIHVSFVVYLISIGILATWSSCICVLSALVIHEFGHYIASRALGERVERIELTPFGGMMYCAQQKGRAKGLRGIVIALAGPLANYAFILLATSAKLRPLFRGEILKQLVTSNLAMLSINLLPVLPLDGGQAVFCIGYYLFRVSALISVLTALGLAAGIALVVFAVYGLVKLNVLNCSLLMIGFYLIKHAYEHDHLLKAENLYLIVRERMNKKEKTLPVRLFDVPPEVPLHALLMYMDDRSTSVFLYKNTGRISFVSEQQVCEEMLRNPHLSFAQLNQSL